MPSSTSNSDADCTINDEPVSVWPVLSDLATIAIVLGGLACVAISFLRTTPPPARAPDWFWMMKADWVDAANVVVAGDSRIYRGIAPESIVTEMRHPTLNLGFSSAKYNRGYLDYIDNALNHDRDSDRIVFLGISPFSFGDRDVSGFEDAMKANAERRLPISMLREYERIGYAFEPIDAAILFGGHLPTRFSRPAGADYRQVFHDDGWVGSDRIVDSPHETWRAKLPEIALQHPTDPRRIDLLLQKVSEWTRGGVTVIGFATPVPLETLEKECNLWNVDFARLKTQFESNGGLWVDPDDTGLRWYDGSHLDEKSARIFSRRLAESAMKAIEKRHVADP